MPTGRDDSADERVQQVTSEQAFEMEQDLRVHHRRLDEAVKVAERIEEWARGEGAHPSSMLLTKWAYDIRAAAAGEPVIGKYGSSPDPMLSTDATAVDAVTRSSRSAAPEADDEQRCEHQQFVFRSVEGVDIPVDRGIATLVSAAWDAGLSTHASCQGGDGEPSYIAFTDPDGAAKFAGILGLSVGDPLVAIDRGGWYTFDDEPEPPYIEDCRAMPMGGSVLRMVACPGPVVPEGSETE